MLGQRSVPVAARRDGGKSGPVAMRFATLAVSLSLAVALVCAGCSPAERATTPRRRLDADAPHQSKVPSGESGTATSAVAARTAARLPVSEPATSSSLPFSVERAMVHVRRLADEIGVRTAGSQGEKAAADYVAQQLQALGYQPRVEEFDLPNGRRSRNVIAQKPGASPYVLVLGAHLDSKPPSPGANDDATGVGAILAIAEALKRVNVVPTVEFDFFGSEEIIGADRTQHHFGSRHRVASLTNAEKERIAGMMSLDLLGVGDKLYARTMKRGPQTLASDLLAFSRSRLPMTFKLDPAATGMSDHEPFELAGLPALWIESLPDDAYHTPKDVGSHISVDRFARVGTLVSDYIASRGAEDLAKLRR